MILLIGGATHVGKTALAQRLLERYHVPYLSIDHLKMGLIRSGQTSLSPCDSEKALTEFLWPIVREIVKTALENRQNLILEGCYIPFHWEADFREVERKEIQTIFLAMTDAYIQTHFSDIQRYENVIEQRSSDNDLTPEFLIQENRFVRTQCKVFGCKLILIDQEYPAHLEEQLSFGFNNGPHPVLSYE